MHEFLFPFGPQHPALKEPVHFKFEIEDEKIKSASFRLGYAHRGIEKAFESRDYIKNLYLSERICGICSFSHSTTYAMTVEFLADVSVPKRADYIRTVLLELGRLQSHMLWLGIAAHEIGFDTLFMYAWRDRELVLSAIEKITGARVHYGYNCLGGVKRDLSESAISEVKAMLSAFRPRLLEHIAMFSNDSTVAARCKGVGILSEDDARKFCAVGPVARASGVAYDLRATGHYAAYDSLDFTPVVEKEGDVFARVVVRLKEMLQSCDLIEQALDLPPGPFKVIFPRKMKRSEAVGHAEVPRGELFYYIRSNSTFTPERVKVRTPTYANFSSVEPMLVGESISEIPIVFASIDPCMSCTDRVTIVDASGKEKIVRGEDL